MKKEIIGYCVLLFFILLLIVFFIVGWLLFIPLPYKNNVTVNQIENFCNFFSEEEVEIGSIYDKTGTLYHYIKSNQDDSKPADIYVYYPTAVRSESYKLYPQTHSNIDLVTCDFDLEHFQPKKMEAYFVNGKYEVTKVCEALYTDNTVKTILKNEVKAPLKYGAMPLFNINIDFVDLITMIPFLKDKTKDFSFGMMNTNCSTRIDILKSILGLNKQINMYVGKVDCKFIEESIYKSKKCYIFDLVVNGYENLDGKIYIDTENYDVIEINTKNCGNPNYKSFKFSLAEKNKISVNEWNKLKEKLAHEYIK